MKRRPRFLPVDLNRSALVGAAIVLLVIVLSVLVPLLSPYDPVAATGPALAAPGGQHLFGTDQLGRDVFTRTFAAGRLDLILALVGVSAPLLVGTFLGAVLGTTRNRLVVWLWLMVIDAINAFPFVVLVIAIVAVVGPGVTGLLIGLAAVNWARYARIARSRALILRNSDFVEATRVLGYSRLRVLVRHILPNVYSETIAYGLSDFVIVVLTVSSLSFLGAGVNPPTPEWGAMIADGRLYLQTHWWITVFPGLALSFTAIGVALLAHGVSGRYAGEY